MYDDGLDWFAHYGVGHLHGGHSGRYPWGSGKDPFQRVVNFQKHVYGLRKKGMTDEQIRKSMNNMSDDEFRAKITASKDMTWKQNAKIAREMLDKGYSKRAIARKLEVSEGTVRNYLSNDEARANRDKSQIVINILKDNVEKYGYVDVGRGVELWLGKDISENRMKTVLKTLEQEGYTVHNDLTVKQATTQNYTELKVLTKAGVSKGDVLKNTDKIRIPNFGIDEDGKITDRKIEEPVPIDSSRILIRYAHDPGIKRAGIKDSDEDGGLGRDGSIGIRPGVEDISIGGQPVAQIRAVVATKGKVDGYMKGVAYYDPDIPEGYDMVIWTNKKKYEDVFKPLKDDPDNRFGATIKPEEKLIYASKFYTDSKTGESKLSPINIVNEADTWSKWSKTVSSQFLSKQSPVLARRQLELAYAWKKAEFDEIMAIPNPTIRRELLLEFAGSCDTASWKLQGAKMPGQSTQLLMPCLSLKDGECYCPNYPNGTELVLIRYPHAGRFEAARVTVNNNNVEGRRLYGMTTREVIGVKPKTRQQLSGADCDGDTVTAIPDPNHEIKTEKYPKELAEFDYDLLYPFPKGAKEVGKGDGFRKQMQMGTVSNLITDMTQQKASLDKIIRATKYSMVVIDAEKHKLDWKKAYKELGIEELKKEFQTGGASTIISRRKQEMEVPERKFGKYIIDETTGKIDHTEYYDPVTGKPQYRETGRTYQKRVPVIDPATYQYDKYGQIKKKNGVPLGDQVIGEDGKPVWKNVGPVRAATTSVKKMLEYDDAFKLTSGGSRENPGTSIEYEYASVANKYKALANNARKMYMATADDPIIDKKMQAEYRDALESINAKIKDAAYHAPLERQAQLYASRVVSAARKNKNIDQDEFDKIQGKALSTGRQKYGAGKEKLTLSEREVEAIEKHAVPKTTLQLLMKEIDKKFLKQMALPREFNGIAPAKLAQVKRMLATGSYTIADVADFAGVSTSTIERALKEDGKK